MCQHSCRCNVGTVLRNAMTAVPGSRSEAAGQLVDGSTGAMQQQGEGSVVAVLCGQAHGHAAQTALHTRAVLDPGCTLKSADMAKRNMERAQMKQEQPPAGDFWAG